MPRHFQPVDVLALFDVFIYERVLEPFNAVADDDHVVMAETEQQKDAQKQRDEHADQQQHLYRWHHGEL